nr:MAG TPA: hypothetical protein [Caudoviricetes sp.]
MVNFEYVFLKNWKGLAVLSFFYNKKTPTVDVSSTSKCNGSIDI